MEDLKISYSCIHAVAALKDNDKGIIVLIANPNPSIIKVFEKNRSIIKNTVNTLKFYWLEIYF